MASLGAVKTFVAVSSLALCCSVARADTTIDSFRAALSSTDSYSLVIKAHEVSNGKVQDQTYFYQYKKPNLSRTEVIDGNGKGSVGLWRGGDTVVAFRKSMPHFRKRFNIHDAKVTSLRGNTLLTPSLFAILDYFGNCNSVLSTQELNVDGIEVTEVTMRRALTHPQSKTIINSDDTTKDVLDISKTSHYPVRWLRYSGDVLVEEFHLYDLKVNTPLDNSLFV